jgi:hypothetical protein
MRQRIKRPLGRVLSGIERYRAEIRTRGAYISGKRIAAASKAPRLRRRMARGRHAGCAEIKVPYGATQPEKHILCSCTVRYSDDKPLR